MNICWKNKWVTGKKILSGGNWTLWVTQGWHRKKSTEGTHFIHDQDVTLNFWRWVMRKQKTRYLDRWSPENEKQYLFEDIRARISQVKLRGRVRVQEAVPKLLLPLGWIASLRESSWEVELSFHQQPELERQGLGLVSTKWCKHPLF